MSFNSKTNEKNKRDEFVGKKKQPENAAVKQVVESVKNKVRDIHNNK